MAARKVLIPVDASEYSAKMFQWYIKNLNRDDDEVIFIHIPNPPELSIFSKDGFKNVPYEEWQKKMIERNKAIEDLEHSFTTDARNAKIRNYRFKTSEGKPGECIIAAADDLKVDHIVMGSRGLGKIGRTFLGSVSDYVLHNCNVPITIVTPQ